MLLDFCKSVRIPVSFKVAFVLRKNDCNKGHLVCSQQMIGTVIDS